MKVEVVGSGFTWLNEPNTSFIINDSIIFDTPQSSTKFMNIDYSKIRYIFITHFHSDHFADLHIVVDYVRHLNPDYKVKVFGPKGIFKRLIKMMKLMGANKRTVAGKVLKCFEFIDIKDHMKFNIEGMEVEAIEVKHSTKPCYGFVFKEGGCSKIVGFTGDTYMCAGVMEIVEKSDVVFIDTASRSHFDSTAHLTREEVVDIKKRYPKKKFYSVHIDSRIQDEFSDKLTIAARGQIIKIK